jgi:hypothetical protein
VPNLSVMDSVEPTIKQLIAILGGWTVITAAAIAWTTKLVNERIFSKWRKDEQSALEGLRHSLSSERMLLESAIRGSQQGQDLSHEKRLLAIEHLWSAILKLRAASDGTRYFLGVLVPTEYDLIFSGKQDTFAAAIDNINDDFVTGAMKTVDDVELDRPYLGEILWLRFFIYRAFVGRLGYLITRGKERRHIGDWREDKGIRQILSGALPESTINTLLNNQNVASIYMVFSQLEAAILEEVSLVLSGRRSASDSFENAKELHQAVSEFVLLTRDQV